METNTKEFLVTAQAYEKNDPYKQTILLHETFFVEDEKEARTLFDNHFRKNFNIMRIYSAIDVTENRV
jgi:hypothetical protein